MLQPIRLEPGEVIYSESGGMSWMSGNVEMKTHSGGGLGRMVKRAMSGESLFITDFYVERSRGTVAFASEFPGKIIPFDLRAGESIIVQKDAFMCAEKSVDMDMHFRKRLGTGFFGGEGFIMQRITGPGLAFIEVDGEVVEYDLEPGQQLKVDTGHLAAMEASVDFDVTMLKGFRNILLGGEGLFLASVRGPGKVWLQTMPMSKLAQKIAQFMPQVGGKGSSGGMNIDLGSLLGGG
ncbi:MAG: TIGR00266 family protein [Anaerolineae bacterium]